jgi:hypothetical protein
MMQLVQSMKYEFSHISHSETECNSQAVNTSAALYLGGPGLISRPGDRLS